MAKTWDIREVSSEDDNVRRTLVNDNGSLVEMAYNVDLEELFWELHGILGYDLHG